MTIHTCAVPMTQIVGLTLPNPTYFPDLSCFIFIFLTLEEMTRRKNIRVEQGDQCWNKIFCGPSENLQFLRLEKVVENLDKVFHTESRKESESSQNNVFLYWHNYWSVIVYMRCYHFNNFKNLMHDTMCWFSFAGTTNAKQWYHWSVGCSESIFLVIKGQNAAWLRSHEQPHLGSHVGNSPRFV